MEAQYFPLVRCDIPTSLDIIYTSDARLNQIIDLIKTKAEVVDFCLKKKSKLIITVFSMMDSFRLQSSNLEILGHKLSFSQLKTKGPSFLKESDSVMVKFDPEMTHKQQLLGFLGRRLGVELTERSSKSTFGRIALKLDTSGVYPRKVANQNPSSILLTNLNPSQELPVVRPFNTNFNGVKRGTQNTTINSHCRKTRKTVVKNNKSSKLLRTVKVGTKNRRAKIISMMFASGSKTCFSELESLESAGQRRVKQKQRQKQIKSHEIPLRAWKGSQQSESTDGSEISTKSSSGNLYDSHFDGKKLFERMQPRKINKMALLKLSDGLLEEIKLKQQNFRKIGAEIAREKNRRYLKKLEKLNP